MSQFTSFDVTVDNVDYTYQPYDRGAKGAFVFREVGASVHAPRIVLSTDANDNASDRMTIQLNVPRICPSDDCSPEMVLGTDLVKTELRFLATTSKQDRILQIDKLIAALQEHRGLIEERNVMYS